MNRIQLIRRGFKVLCAIGLMFVLCTDFVSAQRTPTTKPEITDDTFKKKTAKGFVLIKFTAAYQKKNLDSKLFDGIKGFEGCIIYEVNHSNVKKAIKKLRIRNYPSVALFHNGKKVVVWKGDMDGELDIDNGDIKSAIGGVLAEDVF